MVGWSTGEEGGRGQEYHKDQNVKHLAESAIPSHRAGEEISDLFVCTNCQAGPDIESRCWAGIKPRAAVTACR